MLTREALRCTPHKNPGETVSIGVKACRRNLADVLHAVRAGCTPRVVTRGSSSWGARVPIGEISPLTPGVGGLPRYSVAEFRRRLSTLADARSGSSLVVTNRGIPVAVVRPPGTWEGSR